MNTNSFDNFESFSTKFTADEINQLIGQCLADICSKIKIKYNITEETHDDMTTWCVEFLLASRIIQYDTWSKLPKHKISLTFKEGKAGKSNLVEFMDCSTAKSQFCRDKILILNSFITEKEKKSA
jgi:hypothetical protein